MKLTFLENLLNEQEQFINESIKNIKENQKVMVGGKEVEFGSSIHLSDLKRTVNSLMSLRDCYPKGSGTRMVLANCIIKLKGLIQKLEPKKDDEQKIEIID